MARNKMTDVRDHLILAMEKLHDGDMEVPQAKAMAEIGKVLVESAKAEVDFIKATGMITKGSGFVNMEGLIENNDKGKLE